MGVLWNRPEYDPFIPMQLKKRAPDQSGALFVNRLKNHMGDEDNDWQSHHGALDENNKQFQEAHWYF